MKLRKILILPAFLVVWLNMASLSQAAPAPEAFSQAELDQMLAPVALYPDTVLSHVLIAATYPLEVVQAARWSRNHPELRAEAAVNAAESMDWDPSVIALTAFPELLQRMGEDLDWTRRLGDAFLIQEAQVLDTVQYLRAEAHKNGHLRSDEHVRVVREIEYISIEPAMTEVVYVPYYNPHLVYTYWRWPAYPPHYWHYPHSHHSGLHFYWGHGYRIAPLWFYFSAFHWPRHQVVVHHHHRYRHHHHAQHRKFHSGREVARHKEARHWQHDRQRRGNVRYPRGVQERRFARQSTEPARQPSSPAHAVQSRREHDRAGNRNAWLSSANRPEPQRRQQATPARQGFSATRSELQHRTRSLATPPATRPNRGQEVPANAHSPRQRQPWQRTTGAIGKQQSVTERRRSPAAVTQAPRRKIEQLQHNGRAARAAAPARRAEPAARSSPIQRMAPAKRFPGSQYPSNSPRAAWSQPASSARQAKSFRGSADNGRRTRAD